MDKALIITPFNPANIGGAESFAHDLARALTKKYPQVHVSTLKKQQIWKGLNYLKALGLLLPLMRATRKLIKKYKYKKVYALGLISSLVCVLLRVKFHSIIIALYDFKKPNLYGWLLNRAEKVFVEGFQGEQDLINAGVNWQKIVKFQHWVNLNKFRYIEKDNKNLKVLFVGRPIRIKGRHVIEECEKITKGIEYEYLTDVPSEDMPKHYQMADVVVVPSLYSEGFCKVVVEAAACGCALITSDNGALPEMVRHFGRIIKPTPENFARELTDLKNNKTGLQKIQMNTALYALNHFSSKNAEVFL